MGQETRYLIFSLEGEDYAITIERLVEITVPRGLRKDDSLTEHFEGTVEIRGKILPVLNLKKVFTLPAAPGNVLLVLRTAGGETGVLVDAVTEMMDTEAQPRSIPKGVLNPSLPYFRGILKHKGSMLFLLNEDGLL